MFDVIDINPEAEGVYEALATGRPATSDELTGTTGLPPHRLRAALHSLEARGLVSRTSGSPPRYVAADPGIALDVLLLQREEQIKRARLRAQQLAEQFNHATSRSDPAELVEVLTGRQAVLQRVQQAWRSARHELRSFDKPPYATDPIALNEIEVDLLRRGGTARCIYERAAVEVPGRIVDLELGAAAGEQMRILPRLPVKLTLVDDRIAVVPLQAAPTSIQSAVVVHPSALLEAIAALFETLWQLALPLVLPTLDPGPIDHPSPEERRILGLLTGGLPDQAVARQLGLSERTYQRRVHRLMKRLHVQTRFQLALQATRRGWLDLGDANGQGGSDVDPALVALPCRVAPVPDQAGMTRHPVRCD